MVILLIKFLLFALKSLFKTNCSKQIVHLKSLPALHASRVMANVGRCKIKPSLEWSDDQIPANSAFSDVTEIEWYDPQNDELEVITADSDASTAQPGRYEGLVPRELAWKRCEWFDGMR